MKNIKLLSIISLCILSWGVSGQISGTVFRDFNANGTKDNSATFNEVGVGGVTVKAYDAAGAQVGSLLSAADGSYSFTGLTLPVRLEFIPSLVQDFDGSNGAQGSTSVQFFSAATTTANFGLNYPANYCQSNPDLITPNYINGRPSGPGNGVLLKYPYSASGQTSVNVSLAQADQIGATWGIAYNKISEEIYASAFVKRHVAMIDNDGNGKEDLGAIYTLTSTGGPALWLDVASLGVDFGQSVFPSIATRNLPSVKTTGSFDAAIFDLVGKSGIGSIEISDDNSELYVMNLYDNKIYTINIATKTLVGSGKLVPNECTGGQARPFALKYHRGKLYVGSICDAETSAVNTDLRANIYKLEGGTFTNILTFPLNYVKGGAFQNSATQWYPWKPAFYPVMNWPILGTSYPMLPQPLLSDIEFDVNEDVILSFVDRLGHQTGNSNRGTNPADPELYSGVTGGDILRASLVNGSYVIENNGSAGGVVTSGAGNSQGIGGGEFYFEENYGNHHETVQGGTTLLAGSGDVAVIVMDPFAIYSSGTSFLGNITGAKNRAYEIVPSNTSPATFGKAIGLGDVELLCNPAPIEIGNRVWMDTDKDGVQDADEMGLDGISVKLYNGATLVASKTTATGGQYYFGTADGVLPNTAYTLRIEAAGFPAGKFVTLKDQPTGGVQDLGDNDASLVGGNADISYTTGNPGENNHTLDFGFSAAPVSNCSPDSIKICAGSLAELVAADGYSNYKWYIVNAPGDTVEVATGQTFTTSILGNYIYKATDGSGCPIKLCCPVTVADSTCCVINNVNLVMGNCENKGTLSNANDDEYTFTLNPSGNGVGATYTVNGLPNSPQTGTYGSPTTFGPYLINAGVLNISVVDNVSNTCTKTASVTPPPSCSVCNVSAPVLAVNDNICPSRTGAINLVQDCGAGSFIQYSSNNGLTWSTGRPLYSTIAKTVLARCVNTADTTCKSSNASVTTDPKKCTGGGFDCSLIATATIDPCQDNSTGDVAADDYFTIQVNASASYGGVSQRYEVVIGASLPTGLGGNVLNSGGTLYGSPVTVGQNKQFKADGSSVYALIVRDIDTKSCFQQVNITPVAPCSALPPKSPCYPVPCVPIGLQKN